MSSRPPTSEAQLAAVTVGDVVPHDAEIELVEYDPAWPALFAREEARIRRALGGRVARLEHVGSTSVPGLAAKPRIDILLVVADSADEASYVPDLEATGYLLRIREPDWHEHRVLKGREPTSTCTSSRPARPRSTASSPSAIGCGGIPTIGSSTNGRSGS